jgi:UPF0042 nucleotide-binding protein
VGQFLRERHYSISVKHRDADLNQKGGTAR